MERDKNWVVQSFEGLCVNYNPDKNRPTKLKAQNLEGQTICECLNFKEDSEKKETNYCRQKYCSNLQFKISRQLKGDSQIQDDLDKDTCAIRSYD